ncbi:MAG: hypothetical protein U0269_13125 [Polyangiales bacterium]
MTSARSPLWNALFATARYCADALGERPLFGAARGRRGLFLGDATVEAAFIDACSTIVPDLVEEYGDAETVEEVLFDKEYECVADVYEACFLELTVVERARALGVLADDLERTSEEEGLMAALAAYEDIPRPSEVAALLREAAGEG